jgi:MFS family permease
MRWLLAGACGGGARRGGGRRRARRRPCTRHRAQPLGALGQELRKRMPIAPSGFVWTAAARRQVNVLIGMQAMHMAAGQVVLLASEDLLVEMLQAKVRRQAKDQRAAAGEVDDEAEYEQAVKTKANSMAAHILSTVQVVIALGDFVIGPLLGAAADAYGRKWMCIIAPLVQGLFRALIAVRPSVPLFVAFQMAQGLTNIAYGRVLQLMIGDIVPRHTFEYQRVGGISSKVNTVLGLGFMLIGGRVSLRAGFLSSALINLLAVLALTFTFQDTLPASQRIPFTFKNSHPFAFVSFFRKSKMLRNIGIFSLISEAPNFQGYDGLFQIHKFGWMKRERTNLQLIRRSIHFFNFNFYEWMARHLGLTSTLRWGIRCTALEALVPGLISSSWSRTCMGSIIAASVPIHKWKAMNAFKTRETMLAGAGQGELQAAEASLRVPLRIVCIPLSNWLYAKGSEWGWPGLAHTVRGVWHLFSSEILVRWLFPGGVGEMVWK